MIHDELKNIFKFATRDTRMSTASLDCTIPANDFLTCNCLEYKLEKFPLSVQCEQHPNACCNDITDQKRARCQVDDLQVICVNEIQNMMIRYDMKSCIYELPELSTRLLFNGMTLSEICVLLLRYNTKRIKWSENLHTSTTVGRTGHENIFERSYNAITKYVYNSLTTIVDNILNISKQHKSTTQNKQFKTDFVRLLKQEKKYIRQFKKHSVVIKKPRSTYKYKRKRHDLYFSSIWIEAVDEYIRACSLLANQTDEMCPSYKRQLIYQKCEIFMTNFHNEFVQFNM